MTTTPLPTPEQLRGATTEQLELTYKVLKQINFGRLYSDPDADKHIEVRRQVLIGAELRRRRRAKRTLEEIAAEHEAGDLTRCASCENVFKPGERGYHLFIVSPAPLLGPRKTFRYECSSCHARSMMRAFMSTTY